MAAKEEKVIERLIRFADWCKKGNLCRSRSDFERECGLSHNYLYNSMLNSKSSVGTDQIRSIYARFPMLNLTWVITGKGAMISHTPDIGYREAYEELKKKMDEIAKIAGSI